MGAGVGVGWVLVWGRVGVTLSDVCLHTGCSSIQERVYMRCVLLPPQAARLCSTASGTIPLKLPKALVLSQFSGVSAGRLPLVVPLDVVVDGQPAGGSGFLVLKACEASRALQSAVCGLSISVCMLK